MTDRDLEGEMLRNLCTQANDLSAVSAEEHRQLTKASVITLENVVQLSEETEQKEVKDRKRMQTATAGKKIEGLSSTSNEEKQHSMVKCAGTI